MSKIPTAKAILFKNLAEDQLDSTSLQVLANVIGAMEEYKDLHTSRLKEHLEFVIKCYLSKHKDDNGPEIELIKLIDKEVTNE